MQEYVKLKSPQNIEFAPKNKGSVVNYNRNIELLKADGYKPFISAERLADGRTYSITYFEDEENVYEKVNYSESLEEFKKRLGKEKKEFKKQAIESQIREIDLKRIRALSEPSVKDENTGETWLEFYNAQITALRNELNELEETNVTE